MPRDDDEMLRGVPADFGSGIIGVCDVCGHRQAVIVLQKERFKLCVIDFLNKTWTQPGLTPGAPLPLYRSERIWFPTEATKEGKAAAVLLIPTKVVKRPGILITPDVFGLTTSVLDAAIRFAREGFEVLLPDVARISSVGPGDHAALRMGSRVRGGIPLDAPRVRHLRTLYADGLRYLRARELVDPEKTGLFGTSYGASLAIALAISDPSISALMLAYPSPVRPADQLALLSGGVLVVHAGADGSSTKARGQFARASGVDVQFADFAGRRRHFLARDQSAYDVADAEAAWVQILAFARQRLLPPPPKPPAPTKSAAAVAPPATSPATPPSAPVVPSAASPARV